MLDFDWTINTPSSESSLSSVGDDYRRARRIHKVTGNEMTDVRQPRAGSTHTKHDGSLDKVLETTLEALHKSGFDGFETLVTHYYTSKFDHSPRLASSQHLSRNRKLPGILETISESAMAWSEWEAQGYRSAVVRSAESILSAEREKLVASRALWHAAQQDDAEENDQSDQGRQTDSCLNVALFQREVCSNSRPRNSR